MFRILRDYRHLLRPVRGKIAAALVCGAIYGAASGFGLPFMMKKALPALFEKNGPQDMTFAAFPAWLGWQDWIIPSRHVLMFSVCLLPIMFIIRGLSQFGKDYWINDAGLRVLESVRLAVFEKLQRLHLDFFRKIPSGDIQSRMNGDAAMVRAALVDVLGDLVIQPLTLIGALGYVVFEAANTPGMDRFLLALAVIPLSVLPIRALGKQLHRRSKTALQQAGDMNGILIESLQAPREIRAYGLENREVARYAEQTGKLVRLQLKQVKYLKMTSPIVEVLAAFGIAFAIYQIAGSGVTITKDQVIALVTALFMAYTPVKVLGTVSTRLRQSEAAMERLEAILRAPVEVADPATPRPMPAPRGEIRFENVSFAYPAGATVFRDTSLVVAPGEVVALVGASGSGKTTFANLVPRFYDVTAGRVLVDGADVRDVAQAELRARIALVSQEPILFDDTVAANLRIGKPDATEAELETAAEQAGALDFIRALPDGFATRVGERGGLVSGGQRQRLAIARAFLKNAPILILDEATSALDSETEAQVQDALERLARGKTVLIIAHRFSTIRFASRILVFDKDGGGIAADGAHDTLIAESPLYRNLYERQKFGEA